jgi:hypothetical protein
MLPQPLRLGEIFHACFPFIVLSVKNSYPSYSYSPKNSKHSYAIIAWSGRHCVRHMTVCMRLSGTKNLNISWLERTIHRKTKQMHLQKMADMNDESDVTPKQGGSFFLGLSCPYIQRNRRPAINLMVPLCDD